VVMKLVRDVLLLCQELLCPLWGGVRRWLCRCLWLCWLVLCCGDCCQELIQFLLKGWLCWWCCNWSWGAGGLWASPSAIDILATNAVVLVSGTCEAHWVIAWGRAASVLKVGRRAHLIRHIGNWPCHRLEELVRWIGWHLHWSWLLLQLWLLRHKPEAKLFCKRL